MREILNGREPDTFFGSNEALIMRRASELKPDGLVRGIKQAYSNGAQLLLLLACYLKYLFEEHVADQLNAALVALGAFELAIWSLIHPEEYLQVKALEVKAVLPADTRCRYYCLVLLVLAEGIYGFCLDHGDRERPTQDCQRGIHCQGGEH